MHFQDEKKCFNFEQPRDTPLVINYEILDVGHKVEFDLYYGTSPVPSLQIMHKVLSDAVGHIDFTTDNSGFYSYCLKHFQREDHPTRFKVNIFYGYDSEYYENLSKEQKFDAVNMEVHKLNDMLTMTINEADYQKHKEVDYHLQTERMNSAALWWPMVQVSLNIISIIITFNYLLTNL